MTTFIDSAASIGKDVGQRFLRIGVVPSLFLIGYFWVLIEAGAPGHHPTFKALVSAVSNMSAASFVALAVAVIVLALVFQPLQITILRLLEGYWPERGPLAYVTSRARERYRRQWTKLKAGTTVERTEDPEGIEQARRAAWRWRTRFPPLEDRVMPTALGNVLRAAEDRAGSVYGFDSVTAWPRLYPLLSERLIAVVNDRRDQLDIAARLAFVFAIAAAGSLALLIPNGGFWLLLPIAMAGLAWVSYLGGIASAISYGEIIYVAFDLHRFDLVQAMHLELPSDNISERELNERLSRQWVMDSCENLTYRHKQREE